MDHVDTINPTVTIPAYLEPEWVDTPTGTQIRQALTYAQSAPTIAMVYGGAGLGKTHTARRYCTENIGRFESSRATVHLVTAHPGMSTVASALYAIGEAVGCTAGHAYRNDALTRQILQALRAGDLLIVDEAQHLDIKALDQIRHFHDVGGIGVAYLGNDEIYTRINGRGKQAAFLGPLASRVGMRLSVPRPREGDVIAILKAWNVHGEKENEYAQSLGMSSIGLRGLTQVLRQAATISQGMNRLLDARIMRAAAANLGYI